MLMQLMLIKLIINSVLNDVVILMFKSTKERWEFHPINGKNQLKHRLTIAIATKRIIDHLDDSCDIKQPPNPHFCIFMSQVCS